MMALPLRMSRRNRAVSAVDRMADREAAMMMPTAQLGSTDMARVA